MTTDILSIKLGETKKEQFRKYGVEYDVPSFGSVLGLSSENVMCAKYYYLSCDYSNSAKFRDAVDKYTICITKSFKNIRAENLGIIDSIKLRKAIKQLKKVVKEENIKIYTYSEKCKVIDDYKKAKELELQKAIETKTM